MSIPGPLPSQTDTSPPAAVLGESRRRVLDELETAASTLTAAEVAERLGLHLNTARFHLDGLVEQGLADRRAEGGGTPGRPRIHYSARPSARGPRSYRLLSRMLVDLVRALDPDPTTATEVGRQWGRRLADAPAAPPAPEERATEGDLARLTAVMDAVGFAPETVRGTVDEPTEVHLHHCPFLEVAQENTDVVCAVHLGLMQGVLGARRSPVEVDTLVPFASPGVCVARLRA